MKQAVSTNLTPIRFQSKCKQLLRGDFCFGCMKLEDANRSCTRNAVCRISTHTVEEARTVDEIGGFG
jgi:hypothetical protein